MAAAQELRSRNVTLLRRCKPGQEGAIPGWDEGREGGWVGYVPLFQDIDFISVEKYRKTLLCLYQQITRKSKQLLR